MASGRKHAAQPRAPVPARGAGKNRHHATPGWGAWEPLAATGGGAGGGGRRAARGLGGRCRRCCCGMLGRRRPSLSQLLGSLGGQWRSSGAQRRLLVRGGLLWRLLPDQLVLLLECLLEERTLCARSLQRLERVYGLREQDAEVRHRWCELVVKHKYTDAYGDIETFLRDDQWSPDFLMPLRNTTSRWRKKQVLLRPSLCRPRWRQGHPLNLSGSSNKSPDTLTMGHSRSEIIFAGAMGVYLYGELMVSEDAKQQELARRCFAAVQDDMDASSLRVVQEMLF